MKEFLSLYERLRHILFVIMFRLYSICRLPSKFLVLQDQSMLCPSCIFAQAKRKPWRQGRRQAGTVIRDHHTKPGDDTMCDHDMSAQPGLVPQMHGRRTEDRITTVSIFLDSASNHSFSDICRG